MIVLDRPVRFEEVDAAGILFYARYFTYCHDAMERLFDAVPGGYVDLIVRRRIGFPAVHVAADFRGPLRYGDVARIEVSVARIGDTSLTLAYRLRRASDGGDVASVEHVAVATHLDTMKKTPIPDDVRAVMNGHVAPK